MILNGCEESNGAPSHHVLVIGRFVRIRPCYIRGPVDTGRMRIRLAKGRDCKILHHAGLT